MAFQPRFEHPYGFAFLDEMHNFFPEFLYDNDIFNHIQIRWMRDRVQTLFPQAYARQSHMYGIYGRTTRQREFSEWISHQTIMQSQPPLPPPVATREQQSQDGNRSLGVGPEFARAAMPTQSAAETSAAETSTAETSAAETTVIPDIIMSTVQSVSPPSPAVTTADPRIILGNNQSMIQNLLRGLTAVRSGEIRSTMTTSVSAEPSAENSRAVTPLHPDDEIILQSLQTPPRIQYRIRTNQNPIRNYRVPVPPSNISVSYTHLTLPTKRIV